MQPTAQPLHWIKDGTSTYVLTNGTQSFARIGTIVASNNRPTGAYLYQLVGQRAVWNAGRDLKKIAALILRITHPHSSP